MSSFSPDIQLIGLYGSPDTRRVAISMHVLGIAFEHRPLGIFRDAKELARANPLMRVPTMVFGNGDVLTESSFMLDVLDELAATRRLIPLQGLERRRALQSIAIAKAAIDKASLYAVEALLRPEELRFAPMVERARSQVVTALGMLEARLPTQPIDDKALDQVAITSAVMVAHVKGVDEALWDVTVTPRLAALSAACESLPEFQITVPG